MSSRTFPLFTFRGIAIKADASWLLIVALVTWMLWNRYVVWYDRPGGAAAVMAIVSSVLFFGSVLAHELAHALEARVRGVQVSGITLFLFGGATETKFDVKRPRDEFALTAVGPFTSIVLAAVFGLGAYAADEQGLHAAGNVLGTLGWTNLLLGVFNLLPGAPLDGGRILRAGVWWITGNRRRAMIFAANAGRVLAFLIILLGLLQFFAPEGPFFGGLWLVFIGWFLLRAASAERVQADVQELLSGRTARFLLDRPAPAVPADARVGDVVDGWFRRSDEHAFPVAGDAETIGVLEEADVASALRRRDEHATARELMRPLADLPAVDVDADAVDALDQLDQRGVVVVVEDGRFAGLITERGAGNVLRRSMELERRVAAGRR
jgi:Zn-dependent protease/predicted transcriptional regulator